VSHRGSVWTWGVAESPWHVLYRDGLGVADLALSPFWRPTALDGRNIAAPCRWRAVRVRSGPKWVAGLMLTPAAFPETAIAFLTPDLGEWGRLSGVTLPPLVVGDDRLDFPRLPSTMPPLERRAA